MPVLTPQESDGTGRPGRRPATSRAELEQVAFGLSAAHGCDATTVDQLTGYAGGLARKRDLLEIEHSGALRAGRPGEGRLW